MPPAATSNRIAGIPVEELEARRNPPSDLADRTDRELLEAMVRSQMRVETQVTEFLNTARPVLDTVGKRGIMGLMGMGK